MSASERCAVGLTCIDGHIHDAMTGWIRLRLPVDVVDLVTVQCPDRVAAHEDDAWVTRLAERVQVSQHAHGRTSLVIVSHADCAGHPVSDAEHRNDLARAVTRLRPLLPGMHLLAAHVGLVRGVWTPVHVLPAEAR